MTTSDERALLDTNIVVYAADAGSPFHVPAKELRDRGFRGELPLVISPQVLLEFFAVITHPRRVQTPRSPQEATAEMAKYMRSRRIRMIYPGADILRRVLAVHAQHPTISRQEIFDLSLLATMLSNGVTRIYTYNERPFRQIQGITVLIP